MARILTLDLGTTYFKAALFDDDGELVALAHEPLKISHPKPRWWELPNNQFEQHVTKLLHELRGQSDHGFDGVAAMSFATQTNSIRLLDGNDRAWSPLVLWPDERSIDMPSQLADVIGSIDHLGLTGIPQITGQFTPGRLVRWAQTNDRWHEVRRVCLISDLLTLWFTGEHVTEAGAAGLTGMVDIHKLKWIPQMVAVTELEESCFARIVRAGTDLGPIRPGAAEQFGLPKSCRFVVGCLDQYAGAIGAGNVVSGCVSETTGTVLATVRCADHFDPQPAENVFQGPGFDPGIYFHLVFGSTSANLLEAYRNALPDRPDFAELDRLAAEAAPGPGPGAGGLSVAADADPMDPATLFGTDPASLDRGLATRAILETVAHALAEQVDQLCGDDRPAEIRCAGGAARSDLWRQIKADILNCPVVATACPEPTSLGAALLAASALDPATDLTAIAHRWIQTRPPDLPHIDP